MSDLRIANLRAALEKIGQTGCRCRTSTIRPCRSCVAKGALAADDCLANPTICEHCGKDIDPANPHRLDWGICWRGVPMGVLPE